MDRAGDTIVKSLCELFEVYLLASVEGIKRNS